MLAAAILGGSAISGLAGIFGAKKGADAQSRAAQAAIDAQLRMFGITQANLAPYNQAGQQAIEQALGMAKGGFRFNPTMAELEQTPGYQFAQQQGLKSTQNSAAARGLGTSGAAMRGAADYSTGLASNTYQQQFGNALQSWQNNYNALMGIGTLGENAAANVGTAATNAGTGLSNALMGQGNAQAASYMAMANSAGNAINNGLMGYLYASRNGLTGAGGGNPYNPSWSNTQIV